MWWSVMNECALTSATKFKWLLVPNTYNYSAIFYTGHKPFPSLVLAKVCSVFSVVLVFESVDEIHNSGTIQMKAVAHIGPTFFDKNRWHEIPTLHRPNNEATEQSSSTRNFLNLNTYFFKQMPLSSKERPLLAVKIERSRPWGVIRTESLFSSKYRRNCNFCVRMLLSPFSLLYV